MIYNRANVVAVQWQFQDLTLGGWGVDFVNGGVTIQATINHKQFQLLHNKPMMEIGFVANRIRPRRPIYLLLHPADQRRITYSTPKKTTRTISWNRKLEFDEYMFCNMSE